MPVKIKIPVFFTIAMLIASVFVTGSVVEGFSQTPAVKPDSSETSSESNSAIKSKVIYHSLDSIRFDVENQKVFLYGEASVKYEDMKLNADYIEFDMLKNIAYSRGARDSAGGVLVDSSGFPIGDPVFAEGEKSFDAKEITYNFETKKGKIREVTTQEGEGFVHAKYAKKDTGDVYYIKNGKYTTCDLEHPHFYINSSKLKIIPDDKIISGPANIVIADIPLPLGIPFGVFPNKKGRKSGVMIPFYGESNLGYFLKDGGYYFGMSDYFDLALRGDIYSKGSFGVKGNTNYKKRYKYNGNLGLSYANIKISEKEFPDYTETEDYFIRWTHNQDAKSNPTFRFAANVNAGSRTYQKYNSHTSGEYLTNTFQSNISLNKSWQGRPNNLSINASHSQNTLNKTVSVVLPEAAFTMGRKYFRRKSFAGKPNMFQKIGISPAIYAKNQITTIDEELFEPNSINKFQNGLKISAPMSTSGNLGPVIFTPSVGLNAYGYFQSINKRWDDLDSVVYIDTLRDFKYAYDANVAISASTKIYGMYSFRRGQVKAIRHVMTPGASLSYRPDFSQARFGFYGIVQTTAIGNEQSYSYFQNAIYGSPPSGKAGFVNFSLNNNLEMKLRPAKKDTSTLDRKVSLIDNLSISSSYNIAAEHFKWSVINVNARTRLLKVMDITLNGTLDPYAYDSSLSKRIDRFEYDVNERPVRLTSAVFSLSTSLHSIVKKQDAKKKKQPPAGKRISEYEDQLKYIQAHPDYYVDFNVPWDLAIYYNVVYAKPALDDTIIQSFTFNGTINVTSKWKVGFRSGFDFVNKDFTYTSFDIYRDLHCWEMSLNWIPFGFRKSYMLTVAVKASVLQDLKMTRKRDWYDYN